MADPSASNAANKKQETGQCNLDRAAINLNGLRDVSKDELVALLSRIDGGSREKKMLIIDPKLTGPLGLLIEFDFLKAQGIEKFYALSPTRMDIPSDIRHVIYLTRPRVQFMTWIADQVHHLKETNKTFTILSVPRTTVLCEAIIEQENLREVVRMEAFHMDLIPFDLDVLSLELPTCLKDCFVDGDSSSLFYVSRALMKMQGMYGIIPHIKGKGVTAQQVANMMIKMRREMQLGLSQTEQPSISELILIDRLVDPITPMLTMLTYEGLVDEFFGIANSSVELPAEMVIDPSAQKDKSLTQAERLKKTKVPLNSNDSIFSDIRDLNFSRVGPNLNDKAHLIDEYYKKRHEALTVPALKAYIGQFADFQQKHKFLRIHTNIVKVLLNMTTDPSFHAQLEAEQNLLAEEGTFELSIEYIEECINKQEPLVKVLRLLCLLSLCTGGLKEKLHTFFVKEIIQTYGFEYLFTLNNLGKLGFLRKQGESKLGNWFANVRQPLKLLALDVNEQDPNDIAYTYSGYAPLSVRLVEYARHSNLAQLANLQPPTTNQNPTKMSSRAMQEDQIKEGWGLPKQYEEAVKAAPGPTFHVQQTFTSSTAIPSDDSEGNSKPDVTLVCFIGGITYAEISALRWLSQKTAKGQKKIILLTTNIVNGNTFVESLFEDVVPKSELS